MVNYADPGSGDDIPDAGALDSDDSDFIASGGTRTSIRQSRNNRMQASASGSSGMNTWNSNSTPGASQSRQEKSELDQSYLGMVPPSKYIKSRPAHPTAHEHP